MAGKNQHYIPQAVLQSFAIPDSRTAQVHVFRREKHFRSSIANVAAEDYFYSVPSSDGTETLDDIMTRHENGPFNRDLKSLLGATPGAIHPDAPAEVLAHLIVRGDHLRGVFRASAPILAEFVDDLLGSSEQIARMMGASGPAPSDLFRERLAKAVDERHPLSQLGLPRPVIEAIAYMMLRENAETGFEEAAEALTAAIDDFRERAGAIAKDAQVKALSGAMIPEGRIEILRQLDWRIVDIDQSTFVLPDFISLAFDKAGRSGTIFSFDAESLIAVLMPLTPSRMLIGGECPASIALADFNVLAASHCLNFFVSAYTDNELQDLRTRIGTEALDPIHQGLAEAASEFRAEIEAGENSDVPQDAGEWRHRQGPDIQFSTDYLDSEAVVALTPILGQLTGYARQRFNTDALIRIVAPADYAHRLATIDRGELDDGEPIRPATDGWSAAYNVPVEENGRQGIVMVLHPDAVAMLLAPDDTLFAAAASILISQFARFGTDHVIGTVFAKGVDAITGGVNRFILPHALRIWKSYMVADGHCRFASDMRDHYRNIFLGALDALPARLVDARRGYWMSENDVDGLLPAAILPTIELLESAACAAASFKSEAGDANIAPFWQALDAIGLAKWFALFRADLKALWEPGTSYPEPAAFNVLVTHVQRILLTGAIFPWDDGSPFGRIEVPFWSDLAWLTEQATMAAEEPESTPAP
ncbi:DUF4238 domain-containing protein [Sphingopyxis sp. LC363]|nr:MULTISPECIES: DUF4238 domain-containing protein [Sphingopyxis]KGB57710.1 hypothetical protein FG95_01665 [Sphingopyxis sp. LC363]GGJ38581.1 hypothetical protein GCM10011393_06050 [Sphingopyxis bauzanensis]